LFERRFPKALRVPAVSAGTIDLLDRRFDGDVLMARVAAVAARRPRLSKILARCGLAGAAWTWQRSTHLDACLQELDTDDGVLNPAAVERLRDANGAADGTAESQRELLFYWQMSRRMFSEPAGRVSELAL
jgi:hypothetical protein